MRKQLKPLLLTPGIALFTSCAAKRIQNDSSEDGEIFVKKKKERWINRAAKGTIDYYGRKYRGELDRHPAENINIPKGTL